jgi:DNA invertase Pin-like site-specific DNA recombinase
MRTALYLRVSTEHQKPDLQADGMRRYAARAKLAIVARYLDVAISGRKEGRPQLQALMRAARNHEFDCVLVWKFDRFARSVTHLLRALEDGGWGVRLPHRGLSTGLKSSHVQRI